MRWQSAAGVFNVFFHAAQDVEFYGWLQNVRRSIHEEPELGLACFKTAEKVRNELVKLNITLKEDNLNWARGQVGDVPSNSDAAMSGLTSLDAGAGIVLDLGTGKSDQPVVLLRADMDALPIVEGVDVSYRSKVPGLMHACGHDAHTTMLLGALKLLREKESELAGTVRFMFQPGEEGYRGGYYMVKEGVLSRAPAVERAFGLHVAPYLPTGVIVALPQPGMAGVSNFEIVIKGSGGHAAVPAMAGNPIPPASQLVLQLQELASREAVDALLTVTEIQSGFTHNVIPKEAKIAGTIRAASMKELDFLATRVRETANFLAAAYRLNATTSIKSIMIPLNNDLKAVKEAEALVQAASLELPAALKADPTAPRRLYSMLKFGGEDFAYVASAVPSAFFLVGTGSGQNPRTNFSVHNPSFALDERILPRGAAFLASLAFQHLQAPRSDSEEL